MTKDGVIHIATIMGFVLELDRFAEPPSTARDPFMRFRYGKAEVYDKAHAVIIYQQDIDDEMFYLKLSKALIRYGKQKAIDKMSKALKLK